MVKLFQIIKEIKGIKETIWKVCVYSNMTDFACNDQIECGKGIFKNVTVLNIKESKVK